MLVSVQSVVGSAGCSTLSTHLALSLDAVLWDCDQSGSCLVVWAGHNPKRPPKTGWLSLEQAWRDDRSQPPPLEEHLSALGKARLLAGAINAHRLEGLSTAELSRWFRSQGDGQTAVADYGRHTEPISADLRVVVVRPHLSAMWRTFARLTRAEQSTADSVWALMSGAADRSAAAKFASGDETVSVDHIQRNWGVKAVRIPWDPKAALTATRGKPPPPKSGYAKAVGALADIIRGSA